jgi:hypothetical protein
MAAEIPMESILGLVAAIVIIVIIVNIIKKVVGGVKKVFGGGKKSSSRGTSKKSGGSKKSDSYNTGYVDCSTSSRSGRYSLPGGPLTKFEEGYFQACYLNDVKAEIGPTGDDYTSMSDFLDSPQYKGMSDGAKELARETMSFLLRDEDIQKYINMTGSSNVKRRFAEYCRVEEQD